jgi:uncharacterized damage-inducible protein DinB
MMLAVAIRSMYEYDNWATTHIIDTAAQVTPEQLNAPGTAGHGSIRETLIHLIATSRAWLSAWDGLLTYEEAMLNRLAPDDYPDISAVQALWSEVGERVLTFARGVTEEDMQRVTTFDLPWDAPGSPSRSLTLWQMMFQVINHGTQHRSEIAAMLTDDGHSPGMIDFVFYTFQQERPIGQ